MAQTFHIEHIHCMPGAQFRRQDVEKSRHVTIFLYDQIGKIPESLVEIDCEHRINLLGVKIEVVLD